MRRGEILASPVVATGDPTVVELLGRLGFDWLFLDTEHAPVGGDARGLVELIRACDAVGVAPTVRVRHNEPSLIASALDAGAHGIWVPRIDSAEAARRAVDAARFPPHGHRGACPVSRAAGYGVDNWDKHLQQLADQTTVILVVESQAGIDEIDSIAAVGGVDAIVFGQFDYSVDRGLAEADFFGGGTVTSVHPLLEDAAEKVLAACRANDITAGTVAWTRDAGLHWVEMGFQMFVFGTDYTMLAAAARALLSDVVALENSAQRSGARVA
jgi:2-keto-3-deoxy-L-rhamnonate aldolase RhmA